MQKYNRSAYVDNTNTVDKATADEEQHLMSMVQSTVAKHFATPPSQTKLRPTAIHYCRTGKTQWTSLRGGRTSPLDGVWRFPPSTHLRGGRS